MGLIDLTADLTYNTNFETEPVQNQTGPEVNNNFQTSDLESSPTEEIGSVNFFSDDLVSGFTQFMTYPDTLYPGEGLNNSGIVDHFPNPHNYDGDTPFGIEGFTADMQKYETLYPSKDTLESSGINNGIVDFFPSPHGLGEHNIDGFVADVQPLSDGFYPNTIELGSVDFFPGGNFSNNFLTSTGFTQNVSSTEFLMVGGETSINQDFMGNELFQSINTLGTYKGAVDFISDSDSYATGFTKNMQPIGGDKLDTQYDIEQFYTDEELSFSVTSGIPSPSVTTYSIADSIFTNVVDDVTTTPEFSVYTLGDFQLGNVAGLETRADTPFTYDQLKQDMNSWNIDDFNIGDFVNFGDNVAGYTQGTYSLGESQFTFEDGAGNPKLEGIGYNGDFSSLSIGYSSIPSLSIPKPTENATSGPFSSNSGFESGDFKLLASDQGFIPRYLQTDGTLGAAEGSIVRDANELNIRSGATTLGKLFGSGKYIPNNDGKGNSLGTKYRDIKNMDGMAQTEYGTGYGDGINNGWMKGLIDSSVPLGKSFSGTTSDIFIRESSGGRFLGRIAKDLIRMTKWQFSANGLLSMAKNGAMTLFNQSENSFQLSAPASFITLVGNMFGLRTTSAFSSISSLVTNAIGGKTEDSMLYYQYRVDHIHSSNLSLAERASAAAAGSPPSIARTLTNRYGEPMYPKRSKLGGKGARAHRLYAAGLPKIDGVKQFNAQDSINILGYGESSSDFKDLIKFYFRDLRNNKTIIFRAFLNNIQDSISPEWNNYRYIGRPDDVYVYKGTSRSVSFSMKVAAFTRWEMIPMWERINYLVGLNYGSYVDTKMDKEGQYYQRNPGMSSPICKITIGDYLTEQTGYIKDFNISVPPDYPWDTIVDDGGKNVIGELPQVVDINMGFQIIPQQVPDSYGKHFGKVGTNDTIGESGLGWLPDMHHGTKNLLDSFKKKHDDYSRREDLNLPSDTENENSDGGTEPDTSDAKEQATNVNYPPR